MARKPVHKWAFKPGMRASAFGWRGSAKATQRLKSASAEIRAVNRADPVTAADGVVALAARIWPAFEHIDTSSGALGNAVRRTLDDLVPILIAAPADEKARAKWLEQLRAAIEDDGVDYLAPISERFGEIALYPALMTLHDDKPVKLTVELPADVHRNLCDYAAVLGHQTGQDLEPARLIAPMLERFMATDRGFAAARKAGSRANRKKPDLSNPLDTDQG